MTPAQMLEPQPAPVGGGSSVANWLFLRLEDDLVAELVQLRRGQGVERYGTELRMGNGRDPLVDALQEAVDLLMYLAQARMVAEHGLPEIRDRASARVHRAVELVAELARELREEG